MPRVRKVGYKNKKKLGIAVDLNGKAKHFANMFIASEHIDGAEELAIKILANVRESKKHIGRKEIINGLY